MKGSLKSNKVTAPLLAFLIGFLIMVFEVYALKKVFLFFTENTYTVSIALSAFLSGLGISGIICSSYVNKYSDKLKILLVGLITVFSLYGIFILSNTSIVNSVLSLIVSTTSFTPETQAFYKGLFIWVYLFVPAFLIGGVFPLLISFNIENQGHSYISGGIIYFLDIIGGAIGSLLTGLYLIPNFGMQFIPILIGIFGFVSLGLISLRHVAPFIVLTSMITWQILFSTEATSKAIPDQVIVDSVEVSNSQSLEKKIIDTAMSEINKPVPLIEQQPDPANPSKKAIVKVPKPKEQEDESKSELPKIRNGEFIAYHSVFGNVVFQKPSPYGVVTVGKTGEGNKFSVLFINYRDMCWSNAHFSETQLGRLTSENLPNWSIVLNMGLGCGFTAQALNESEEVAKLDIVEINPTIIEANRSHFATLNNYVLESKKVKLYNENGIHYIDRMKEGYYDALVIDIEEPGVIQSSPIYTVEYARIIKQKLRVDGMLALWAIKGNTDYNEIMYHTLRQVFKYVYFREDDGNAQLYAADRPLEINDQSLEAWRTKSTSEITINTIENRALEKSYSIKKSFDLPDWFDDPFIRKN